MPIGRFVEWQGSEPRIRPGFYGVRAPADIVGEQRVYDNWDDVRALTILNADPRVHAAMRRRRSSPPPTPSSTRSS